MNDVLRRVAMKLALLLLLLMANGCDKENSPERISSMGETESPQQMTNSVSVQTGEISVTGKLSSLFGLGPCIETDDALYILILTENTKFVNVSSSKDGSNVLLSLGETHLAKGKPIPSQPGRTVVGRKPNIQMKVSYFERFGKEK